MQTDIDTDVESTQSRQKKGHFSRVIQTKKPSWSSLNSTMKFMTRPMTVSKTKRRKKDYWEQLTATRNLPVKTVKWFDTQHTRYGQLTQMKSGQAAEKSTECQTWLKDNFSFL